MAQLTIRNVSKEFGDKGNSIFALSNVNFEVEKGEFLAIMGASGSGKTTLLNCISTIDKPTSGEIKFENFDLVSASENELSVYRSKNISYIFQSYNLVDTLTVYENVILPLQIQGKRVLDYIKKIDEVLKKLSIEQLVNQFPDKLSGGQRQRVAIARAMIDNTSILIADEPTGALDTNNSENLLKLFSEVNEMMKLTIIMVTHDPNVAKYAKRILILKDGKIQKEISYQGNNRDEFLSEIYMAIR
ncbi:ABC transporter ATP-binding protein [Atopobacter phocae]|uniref:ABC transporter ATP-binding protein n=1 Tax=Atopobacter phocae TaxID=136492 RepID=UPI00046FD7D9|nr:ABC transporter ATP-binding protein [Atopobacter phocae]